MVDGRANGGRIKVLQVIRPSTGGAARHVELLVRLLDTRRFDVTVATPDPEGSPFPEKLRRLGAKVTCLRLKRPLAPLSDLRALVQLLRLIRRERFHVVHCHATKAGFLGRIAARLLGVPLVLYTPHGWYFNYEPGLLPRRVHVLAERALARCGSLVVCTGPAEQSQALELRLAPPERIVVVPNAVEMPELSPSGPADEPQVGMVGRLSWPKDPLTFIRAAADVHGEWPKARFVLVGDGELREECMNLLRRQGSGEYVRILGHREDAAELMARFDVCVLCSYWEGMPYSLLESMALGKAVVAPGVPGCADLVTDGVTGLLFPAGDAAALARAIVRLLREPGLRDALGAAARRRAEERHSADRWIRSIEGLYAGVG